MDAAHPVPVPSAPASWRWSRPPPPPSPRLSKTLHTLISASLWLPRHLEVIIQQSAPQSSISIMKHRILPQCCRPRHALVPTCGVCPTPTPRPATTGLCECQLVTSTCVTGSPTTRVIGQKRAVGVANAELQKGTRQEQTLVSSRKP